MGCGACAGKRSNIEYLVTFRDGSTTRVASQPEARVLVQADATEGARSGSFKAVPKIAK